MATYRVPGPLCARTHEISRTNVGTSTLKAAPPPGPVASVKHLLAAKKKQHLNQKARKAATKLKPVPTTREGFVNTIRAFEGVVPHMYRDTKGYVTVGTGFLIENIQTGKLTEEAKTWTFIVRGAGRRATKPEIEADFSAVMQRPWGQKIPAAAFKQYTKLDLDAGKMDELFNQKVNYFWEQLRVEFGAAFDTYPMAAQYALLDMIFNLGRGGDQKKGKTIIRSGLHAFTQLKQALDQRDWRSAGDHSHRRGPSKDRNDTIKSWFYSAAETPAEQYKR
jgi:GH24 family phage-related lysozyme (muramidase)